MMCHLLFCTAAGSRLAYSNTGFALLGRLLEEVDSPTSPKGEQRCNTDRKQSFSPLKPQSDQFTKTGSGQPYGKLIKKIVFN
jgi:CubicO group peptidase (beta-lactamase class C family)